MKLCAMNFSLCKSSLFDSVSYFKAIALVMVVVLHDRILSQYPYIGNLNHILQPIRMPAFMFVSGFLFYYITFKKKQSFAVFTAEKFFRLIVPLITIKFIHAFIRLYKEFSSGVEFYYPQSLDFKHFLIDVLLFPTHEQVGEHLWFVYVLFEIFIIAYFFARKPMLFLFFSGVLFFIPLPDFMGFVRIQQLLFFFSLGVVLASFYKELSIKVFHLGLMAVGSIVLMVFLWQINPEVQLVLLFKGILALVVLVLISFLLFVFNANQESRFLNAFKILGVYSYTVYFLHIYVNQIFVVLLKSYILNFPWYVQALICLIELCLTLSIPVFLNFYFEKYRPNLSFLLFGSKIKKVV